MRGIRLTDAQVLAICKAFRSCFLLNDKIWLFGSRTNLNKRGGDIDLYIETKKDSQEVSESKICFLSKLETTLGEQKIDLVIRSGNFELPIYNVAKEEGIQLL